MSAAVAAGVLSLPIGARAQEVDQAQIERAQRIDAVADVLRPKLRPIGSTELLAVAEVIVDESALAGFDPFFVLALMEYESGFNILARSPTNSKGLMQLQRKTWELVREGPDIWDPVENARSGIRVLKRIKDAGFRRPETILLAYNQGPRIARRWANGLCRMPREAVPYIPGIMARYGRMLRAQGIDPRRSRTLFAWDFPPRLRYIATN